jgi:hypothetical protein
VNLTIINARITGHVGNHRQPRVIRLMLRAKSIGVADSSSCVLPVATIPAISHGTLFRRSVDGDDGAERLAAGQNCRAIASFTTATLGARLSSRRKLAPAEGACPSSQVAGPTSKLCPRTSVLEARSPESTLADDAAAASGR